MKTEQMGSPIHAYIKNITAMLIFGSIGVFVRLIPLSSSEIVAARTLIGSLFLGGILLLRREHTDYGPIKRNLRMLIVTGIVMGLNWMFLFAAYEYTSVSVATLLYYCAPVLVLFLSPFLLGEKLTWPKLTGIAMALFGMVLVNGSKTGGIDDQKGFFYGILAAFFYAALILLNKRIRDVSAVEKTLVQLLAAAVVIGSYAVATHKGEWQMPQGTGLIAMILVGFVHTGIAYLLYISSMRELSGQTVALCSYIDPASALIFSGFFLGEHLNLVQWIGALLILGGSVFGEFGFTKRLSKDER